MFEFCVRLVIAGLLVFLGGAVPQLDFGLTLKVSLAMIVVGAIGFQLDRKKLRSPGFSGLLAAGDAVIIAVFTAAHGVLPSLGFFVLAPIAYAALVYGARSLSMASIAAASLFFAQLAYRQPITMEVMGQVLGVLLVGLVAGRRREVEREIEIQGTPDALADLKERYRQLREAYKELEARNRYDRAGLELSTALIGEPRFWADRLATALASLSGADRILVYIRADFGPSFVVKGIHGLRGEEQAIDADFWLPSAQTRQQAEEMIAVDRPEGKPFATVMPIHAGHIVGLVQMETLGGQGLDQSREILESVSNVIGSAIVDGIQREDRERRRREAEILYDMASLASGADTAASVANRFCRELFEAIAADHVAVNLIELDGVRVIGRQGSEVSLIEKMSFARGPGLPGWIQTEAPELLVFDVRTDSRCPAEEAVKARVGSYFVIPLEVGTGTFGFLSAASFRTGGLDLGAAETLRVAAAELGHALSRLHEVSIPEGIMTPPEFQNHIQGQTGSLVVLNPLRTERLIETFGRPSVAHALRRFSRRVASRLPQGGAVCRRNDGDYLVFLPDCDQAFAGKWANEIAATASMIGLRTPDGSNRIPLAVRARVARLDPQQHEILEGLSA